MKTRMILLLCIALLVPAAALASGKNLATGSLFCEEGNGTAFTLSNVGDRTVAVDVECFDEFGDLSGFLPPGGPTALEPGETEVFWPAPFTSSRAIPAKDS